MKKYVLIISLFCLGIMGVNAQNDIYYIPSKEVKEVKKAKKSSDAKYLEVDLDAGELSILPSDSDEIGFDAEEYEKYCSFVDEAIEDIRGHKQG